MNGKIDLNCDMGEGMDNDALLMPYISSANIACGGHAGNFKTMYKTIDYCKEYNVAIGAHPGFQDRENFGRINIELSDKELYQLVHQQVLVLKVICEVMEARLHHVKLHGALYNMAAKSLKMSEVIVQAVKDVQSDLIFYGLSNSCMIDAAKQIGLKTANEVFADRTYQNDGNLVPRTVQGALITDEEQTLQQVLSMVLKHQVQTLDGQVIVIQPDTLCLHGDGIHAVAYAKKINYMLKQKNISIETV